MHSRSTFGIAEEALLDPAFDVGQGSALGLGFSLRLVRGLASVAGGRLDVAPDRLILLLPARRAKLAAFMVGPEGLEPPTWPL